MESPEESPLSQVVNEAVEASYKDLSSKILTLSQQVTSLQLAVQDISSKSLRSNSSTTSLNSNPPPKLSGMVTHTSNQGPTSYASAAKSSLTKPTSKKSGPSRTTNSSAHIEEVATIPTNNEFFSISYKKTKNVWYFEPSQSVLSKYTQICIFSFTKLQRGIDDISSKVTSINKSLPFDKVPKNFYCVMGRITT